MATDVDAVYLDWGKPEQRAIGITTPSGVAALSLPAGSMGPKVEAAADFVQRTGKRAAIGTLGELRASSPGRTERVSSRTRGASLGTRAATEEGATMATATPAPVEAADPEKKRGFHLPSAYTILFILIVVVAALTWIIPAGRYDYNDDGTPHPGHLPLRRGEPAADHPRLAHRPDQRHVRHRAAEDGSISYYNSGELFGAIDVALFILVIGGFLGVTMKTGAIQTGIAGLVHRLQGRERLLIPILMALFALGGTSYGMAEESLAFYVLVITVMIAAGYDSLIGAALILLGCGIGVLGSTINPFATGIASGFAGVGIDQGLIGRVVILVVGTAIGIWWVMRYAAKVKADPEASLIAADRAKIDAHFKAASSDDGSTAPMTGKQQLVLVLFFLAFVVMIIGVIPWSDLGITFVPTQFWWFPEMTASFLAFSILIGLAGRMTEGALRRRVRRRRARPARRRTDHRHRPRRDRDHDQRPDHGHRPQRGRAGRLGPRRRRLHQPDVRAVPAAVVPDPVVVRPRDGRDADHGAARELRERAPHSSSSPPTRPATAS